MFTLLKGENIGITTELGLWGYVLESELFCSFLVIDFGYPGRTLLLNINGPRDCRTSSWHRGILGENL